MSVLSRLWSKPQRRVVAGHRVGVVGTADGLLGVLVKQQDGGKHQVLAAPVFNGAQAVAQWIDWQRQHQPHTPTSVLLGGEHYRILPLDAPRVPPEERLAAMAYQAQELLDFPPDKVVFDCLDLPPASTGQAVTRLFAVAGMKPEVAKWMVQFREAGLNLDAVDVPEMALRNLSAMVAGQEAHLYLHVGVRSARLVIVWQGELCAFRRFELSARQLAASSDSNVELLVERLALDIQRTADAFARQFHSADLKSLWISSVTKLDALCAALGAQQSLPVRALELEKLLDWQGPGSLSDLDRSVDYTLAVGAALRSAAQVE